MPVLLLQVQHSKTTDCNLKNADSTIIQLNYRHIAHCIAEPKLTEILIVKQIPWKRKPLQSEYGGKVCYPFASWLIIQH